MGTSCHTHIRKKRTSERIRQKISNADLNISAAENNHEIQASSSDSADRAQEEGVIF
jgi:hypothetical protein